MQAQYREARDALVHRAVKTITKQDSWAIAKKIVRCARPIYECPEKFWESSLRSFTCSWDNRGYSKKLGSPCIRPRSIFTQIFNWLLFAWTLWIYLPNLTFVALHIPEIIGVLQKVGESLDSPMLLFSQIFKGLCSHGPCEYLKNLKFVSLPIPEIIGGTSKIWGVPGFA